MPPLLKGMRVCIVSPSAYPLLDPSAGGGLTGGAEAQLFTIGRELSRAGLDVHFLVDDYGQTEQVEIDGMTAHRAAFRYMGGSKKYLIPDWLRILSVLRRIRADFYLIKVPRHLLFLLGIYCKTHGAKLVYIGQKDSDLDESIVRANEGAPGWWLYRYGVSMVSAIVAQTETQQEGYFRLFGLKPVVIRNVLTLPEEEVDGKDKYILWVGNSNNDKQPQLVIELARRLPDIRIRMIMAKSPSQPDDTFITDHLSGLPNLEYMGTVPFPEIAEHFKRARLFISTSKCEGFPNTFLQSWQYKTPVVSLSVDPDGLIQRKGLGRLSETIEKMVKDIEAIYWDDSLCNEIGEKAMRHAIENHSLRTAVSSYSSLFAHLL